MLVDVVSYYSGSRMFFLESFESKSIKKKAVLSNVFDNFHSHEMEELFCLALIVDVFFFFFFSVVFAGFDSRPASSFLSAVSGSTRIQPEPELTIVPLNFNPFFVDRNEM